MGVGWTAPDAPPPSLSIIYLRRIGLARRHSLGIQRPLSAACFFGFVSSKRKENAVAQQPNKNVFPPFVLGLSL